MSSMIDPTDTATTAAQTANVIRQIRAMAVSFAGAGVQYMGLATGRELAPPLDGEDMRDYLLIVQEILARSHAGLDPVNDLDSLLAVSLLRSVLDQL